MLKRLFQLSSGATSFTLLFLSVAMAEPSLYLPKPAPPAWWSTTGASWMGLFVGGRTAGLRYELKNVKAKIYVDARDQILKLGAQNSPDPLVFLADSDLKAGVVLAASGLRFGAALPMDEKTTLEFRFSNTGWKLTRQTVEKKAATAERMDAKVTYTLEGNGKANTIGPIPCELDLRFGQTTCTESLIFNFIGDLDRDGRPDLFWIRNRPATESYDTTWVWLSKNSQLVTLANAETARLQPKPFRSAPTKSLAKFPAKSNAQSQAALEILIPNQWTKALTTTTSQDSWWGVETKKEASALEAFRIWVACLDGTCDEKSYVGLANPGSPRFLVRGRSFTTKGPIEVAQIKKRERGADQDLVFDSFDLVFKNAKLKLVGGSGLYTLETTTKKVVFPLKTMDPDDKPNLFWAGDLNRDGYVDLLFEYPEDEGRGYALFLSPEAATGPISSPNAHVSVFSR